MVSFSIGIPIHNEEKNIKPVLKFIFSEKTPMKLEKVYVVPSGCTDKSVQILKEFKRKYPKIEVIVEEKRRGKASGVNNILKKNQSRILILMNADLRPKRGCLSKILTPILKGECDITFARNIFYKKRNLAGFFYKLIWNLHDDWCKVFPSKGGELLTLKKGILKKIPRTIVNDDSYIIAYALKRGMKIKYVREAKVRTIEKTDFFHYIYHRRRIARGYIQLRQKGMDFSISPFLLMKFIVKEMWKDRGNIHKILLAVFLELVINLLALYDTLWQRTPYIWKK